MDLGDRTARFGTVALAEGVFVQAGLMSHRPASVPARRSSLSGFRFPPEVIMLAVRCAGTCGTACPTATSRSYLPNAVSRWITSQSTGGYSGSPPS
jgi:hypothetical protein